VERIGAAGTRPSVSRFLPSIEKVRLGRPTFYGQVSFFWEGVMYLWLAVALLCHVLALLWHAVACCGMLLALLWHWAGRRQGRWPRPTPQTSSTPNGRPSGAYRSREPRPPRQPSCLSTCFEVVPTQGLFHFSLLTSDQRSLSSPWIQSRQASTTMPLAFPRHSSAG
jgi:hypothetical protein